MKSVSTVEIQLARPFPPAVRHQIHETCKCSTVQPLFARSLVLGCSAVCFHAWSKVLEVGSGMYVR